MTTTTTTAPPAPAARTSPSAESAAVREPLRRAAGWAALVQAATYIVGFGVMGAYLAPEGIADAQQDPASSLSFLLDHQASMYGWYLVLYLVAGAALVVLSLGIRDRLARRTPALAATATAFGLIWSGLLLASGMIALVGQRAVVDLAETDRAEAVSTWSSVSVVQEALGGGIELVGALWVLLLSIAVLRTAALPRELGVLGLGVGIAGVTTVAPGTDAGAVAFGLGFIIWFVWAGIALLRSR